MEPLFGSRCGAAQLSWVDCGVADPTLHTQLREGSKLIITAYRLPGSDELRFRTIILPGGGSAEPARRKILEKVRLPDHRAKSLMLLVQLGEHSVEGNRRWRWMVCGPNWW